MSESSVCRRCGYAGPVDAHYCARCGRAIDPVGVRLRRGFDRMLSSLSPLHVGLLGLALSIPIAVNADRLMVMKFSIPFSLALLARVIGGGYALIGWQWSMPRSLGSRLGRMLLVLAGIGILLVMVWLIDIGLLSVLTAGGDTMVYEIPGVHIEAIGGARRMSIGDVPPYWLAVMVYAFLAATVGNLINRMRQDQIMRAA